MAETQNTAPTSSEAPPVEGMANVAGTENGQNNDNAQDVIMNSHEDAGKSTKTSDQSTNKNILNHMHDGKMTSDKRVSSPWKAATRGAMKRRTTPNSLGEVIARKDSMTTALLKKRSASPTPLPVPSPSRIVTLKYNADQYRARFQNNNTTTAVDGGGTTAAAAAAAAAASSPARAGTATPGAGRAPSAAPMPVDAAANGAPLRVYLNTKVTKHVTEGMKALAKDKPADPLRVLGEFLLKRSAEIETGATTAGEDKEMKGVE